MSSSDYIKKDELCQHIESSICRWCEHYNGGEFSKPCALCKVSLVFCQIDLETKYNLTESEIKPKRPKCGSCKYSMPYIDEKTGYKTHICSNEFRDARYRYDWRGKPYFFYPSRKACKDYVEADSENTQEEK